MKMFTTNLFEEEVQLEGRAYIKNNFEDLYLAEVVEIVRQKLLKLPDSFFKELYNISLANLRRFWLEILEGFKKNYIINDDILDIIDCLETYIYGRYENKFLYNYEPLSIGKNAIQFIKESIYYGDLLPDVTKTLINYLQTPYGKEQEANDFMEKYIEELKIKRQEKAVHHSDGSYTFNQLEKNDKKI